MLGRKPKREEKRGCDCRQPLDFADLVAFLQTVRVGGLLLTEAEAHNMAARIIRHQAGKE